MTLDEILKEKYTEIIKKSIIWQYYDKKMKYLDYKIKLMENGIRGKKLFEFYSHNLLKNFGIYKK